jgi:hypothetical protein
MSEFANVTAEEALDQLEIVKSALEYVNKHGLQGAQVSTQLGAAQDAMVVLQGALAGLNSGTKVQTRFKV